MTEHPELRVPERQSTGFRGTTRAGLVALAVAMFALFPSIFNCALPPSAASEHIANAADLPAKQAVRIADAMHTVLAIDREVYTVEVVERLQNQAGVIRASQHWKEANALPIPALMVRMAAERAASRTNAYSFGLISPWAINKDNLPKTPAETAGLESIIKEPKHPFYEVESRPDGKRQLIALYPDIAVSQACITCHSEHPDSPRRDFHIGDVMGAMIVRVALDDSGEKPSH
jgi:hypothetical protein